MRMQSASGASLYDSYHFELLRNVAQLAAAHLDHRLQRGRLLFEFVVPLNHGLEKKRGALITREPLSRGIYA